MFISQHFFGGVLQAVPSLVGPFIAVFGQQGWGFDAGTEDVVMLSPWVLGVPGHPAGTGVHVLEVKLGSVVCLASTCTLQYSDFCFVFFLLTRQCWGLVLAVPLETGPRP